MLSGDFISENHMNRPNNRPSDVLREFVEDVKLAYGTGDGDDRER